MEDFKSTLFVLLISAVIGGAGYWAVTTLQSGTEHLATQDVKHLQNETNNLNNVASNPNPVISITPDVVPEVPLPVVEKPKVELAKPLKHQALIDEIEKLIKGNIVLRFKSIGPRVGTVQKFLNVYNNTSNRIDNDYGVSTQKAVVEFQKKQGITANGESSAMTFTKMVEWLKKQG